MRVAHFDCFSGISGDMTLAALVDAGVDREAIAHGLNSLQLPIRLVWEQEKRCGISGTHLQVEMNEETQQRFLPEIVKGDKRIVLVEGVARGAVNRVPQVNDIRSNMVRGGAAKPTDLTLREREICETIGPELRRRGLLFAGIDVIGGYLTEINVTSPTGIRAIKKLGGPDLAVAIWDAIEARRRAG